MLYEVITRLAHLPTLAVAHDAREEHLGERDLPEERVAGHDHAGDPEEDDVRGRDHDRRRVVALEVGRAFGPAQRRERPQPAGEPRA